MEQFIPIRGTWDGGYFRGLQHQVSVALTPVVHPLDLNSILSDPRRLPRLFGQEVLPAVLGAIPVLLSIIGRRLPQFVPSDLASHFVYWLAY